MAAPKPQPSESPPAAKGGSARKTARAASVPEDNMSQCVALCQEQRWREAVLLIRRMCVKAQNDGNTDLLESLSAALLKIEYSLRRQMAASMTRGAADLLAKEYLLDVGH